MKNGIQLFCLLICMGVSLRLSSQVIHKPIEYFQKEDYRASINEFNKTIGESVKAWGESDTVFVLQSYMLMGACYEELNKIDSAVIYQEKANEIYLNHVKATNDDYNFNMEEYVANLLLLKQFEKALTTIERFCRIKDLKKVKPEINRFLIQFLNELKEKPYEINTNLIETLLLEINYELNNNTKLYEYHLQIAEVKKSYGQRSTYLLPIYEKLYYEYKAIELIDSSMNYGNLVLNIIHGNQLYNSEYFERYSLFIAADLMKIREYEKSIYIVVDYFNHCGTNENEVTKGLLSLLTTHLSILSLNPPVKYEVLLKVKDYLIKNKAKESNIQLLYDVIVFLIENVVESNQKPESDLNKIYAISKILNKNSLYATCYNTLLVTISRSFEERGNLIMATDINLFLLENINFNAPEDVNIERLKIYKDLARLSIDINEIDQAKGYYKTINEFATQYKLENTHVYSDVLIDMGNMYLGINELNISDSLLQLTLKIQKDNGFNDLKLKINTLISLSLLQNSFGNNSKSNELLLSAKTDFNNLDLSEPLSEYFYCKNYPILLSNLGHSFQKIGDNKNAKIYLIDALDILSNTCKNQDKDKIFCLNNLAILDYGNESGLNYLLKAKDIAEKMDQKPKLLFTIYSNLGEFYRLRNRFYQSEEYFLKALKIVEKEDINYFANLKDVYINLGTLYANYFEFGKADENFKKAIENFKSLYNNRFKFMTEEEFTNLYEKESYNFDIIKNYYFYNKKNVDFYEIDNTYNNIIANSYKSKFHDIYTDEILKADLHLLQRLKSQHSVKYVDKNENFQNEIYSKIDSIENKISRKTSLKNEFTNQKLVTEALSKNLYSNGAITHFSSFRYRNKTSWTDSIIYVALIFKKEDIIPTMVTLCEQDLLESIIARKYTKEADHVNNMYLNKGLYNILWKPLKPYLNDIDTIYFSPSGLLHQISFAAIKKLDGSFLGDEYYLQQVHSTGILTQPEIAKEIRNIAIFGGMDYEAEEQEISKSIANINKDVDYVSRGLYIQDSTRNGKWSYLPGTKKEAENIYNISKNANLTTKLFMGAEAIEEQYKNLDGDKSPSILHIATHGFFFPDPKISKEKLERLAFHTDNPFTIADNPMNRSGLLFSGSNKAWVGDSISLAREDGILTAYEASHTYLKNTELVVLSACETGLGDIKGSEGVYGLQRAFKMAGARYLMMSLWKVPDNATQEFMTTFYTELLTNKKSIRDAYNATQKQMRDKYRDEPYKWAGFVLME